MPVYGRAYPEGIPAQEVSPLPYTLPRGWQYVTGGGVHGEYLYAVAFDRSSHQVIRGREPYTRSGSATGSPSCGRRA
ncbi:hypothetical protein ACWZEH_01915 [Streptomyces sp. QTS137]